jgi:import inner membrane translocase subunit TIM21
MTSLAPYRYRACRAIASALSKAETGASGVPGFGQEESRAIGAVAARFHACAAGSWHQYVQDAVSGARGAPGWRGGRGMQAGQMDERLGSVARRWLSDSSVGGGADGADGAAGGRKGGSGGDAGATSETHAERRKRRREAQKAASLATVEEEAFSAITDRIPERPMGAVESTSYSLVILAALGFAAAVLYAAFSELIFSPKEYTCFSKTLRKIEDDPRVTIRLGTPMKAYGTESQNRSARQRIPHRIYSDDQGREHVQLQFVAKGPSGRATVHADMYEDSEATGGWRYHYLYLTVESPLAQQVVLVKPHQVGDNEAVV